MQRVALTGLLAIDLPEREIRLCDGGFIEYDGDTYRGKDAVFGTVASVDALTEGFGDSVPALSLTLLPPDTTAAVDLSKPGHQTARVRFILAEFVADTGLITSAEVQFDGQIDQTVLTVGRGQRALTISVVSLAERLFEGNIGNSLSPVWHKTVHPGELGHDNATGLSVPVAWGVESPRGGTTGTVGGKGSIGGDGFTMPNIRRY